jgi:hypothetical protein
MVFNYFVRSHFLTGYSYRLSASVLRASIWQGSFEWTPGHLESARRSWLRLRLTFGVTANWAKILASENSIVAQNAAALSTPISPRADTVLAGVIF